MTFGTVLAGGGQAVWPILVALLFGYLLGSIPFGLLLTRAAGLGDVRKIGSGNIGATNVLRTGNKGLAAATLLLDGLKGTAAVLLAAIVLAPMLQGPPPIAPDFAQAEALYVGLICAAGFGALLGHIFPVWLGFKGGKGVATYIGVLFALAWPIGLAFCGIWLAVALVARYSSLASLVAAVVTPLALWLSGPKLLAVVFLVMTGLLFWKHRENIARLRHGTESRIGAKSTTTAGRAGADRSA